MVRSGAYTGDIAQVTKKWEGAVAGYDLVVSPGQQFTGEFIEANLLTPFIQKGYFHNLKARAGQRRRSDWGKVKLTLVPNVESNTTKQN